MPGPAITDATPDATPGDAPDIHLVSGIVVSTNDLLGQGRVLVRLPTLDLELWARLVAPGGGSGTGLFFPPNPESEVLVACELGNPAQAYVLGGLWSALDRPPVDVPVRNMAVRTIRTGLPKVPLGHSIEFDDAEQSVSIVTSTEQKVTLTPDKIEVSTSGGTVSLTLDLTKQSVSIQGPMKIELAAPLGEISIKALRVDIEGTAQTSIKGGMVMIN